MGHESLGETQYGRRGQMGSALLARVILRRPLKGRRICGSLFRQRLWGVMPFGEATKEEQESVRGAERLPDKKRWR